MSATSKALRAAGGLAALAITVSACGSSGGGNSAAAANGGGNSSSMSMSNSTGSSGGSANDASASKAAALRAGLDTLLREHVDLTAFAVQTAVQTKPTSANTKQAIAAINANTDALGKAIGSIYGKAAQQQFVKIWAPHIGYFVDYTLGKATGNSAEVTKANKDLAKYNKQFTAFASSATGLPKSAVAADLNGHIQTLETAIDAIVSKSPQAASDVQMAAMHMDGTADVLAKGIAQTKNIPGNVDGKASGLRAALTGLLIQHVAQTVVVVQTAVGTSLTSPQTQAAVKALDDNTVALGQAIGSLYGTSAQQAFLKMWRAHIGFFVTYTKGLATHNQADVNKAQKQLAGYAKDFGKFLGSATGLPASAVQQDLQGHIQTLEAAIQAVVSNSPAAAKKVSAAESHMAGTAAVLASAITKQKHLS